MNTTFRLCIALVGGFFIEFSGIPSATGQTPELVIAPAQMDSLDATRLRYLERFAPQALREQARSGIPASITLAQAILETSAGSSQLAREANNHFGMKCGPNWAGNVLYKHDDEYQADGQPLLSCFRVFASVEESYAAHTEFLVDPEKYNRYGGLFVLAPTDYAGWARGLQKAGYSHAPHYAARLIEYIERYRLNELDLTAAARPAAPEQRRLALAGTSFLLTRAGETLREVAEDFGFDLAELLAWNEDNFGPDVELPRGTRLFLAPRTAQWNGEKTYHWLQPGQTLNEIAQAYGLRLDELRRRNGLKSGQEPASGARLRLKGRREAGERVVLQRPGNQPAYTIEMLNAEPIERRALPPMNTANTRRLRTVLQTASASVDPAPDPSTFVLTAAAPQSQSMEPVLAAADPGQTLHVVVRGDTLFNIARRYGVSAGDLKQLNALRSNGLREGQVLRVK